MTQSGFGFASEQFRMTKLQLYNWGTFEGMHTVPISPTGFLIVGPSGTGKSTLLDAISAILVPPRYIDFNAAAREAGARGDRGWVSYIRGLWGEARTNVAGDYLKHYLRTGSTWSALAIEFRDTMGKTVVLAQIMWIKGTGNDANAVKRLHYVFERAFDIEEFNVFGTSAMDAKVLKQALPGGRDEFSSYCERFRRLLGIENETALRLLHKTQAAKSLGDLNTLLRQYMLEEPVTFEVAETLVNEFVDLSAAHSAVVTAKQQIEVLRPARQEHQTMEAQRLSLNGLRELREGVDHYRETKRLELLEQSVAAHSIKLDAVTGAYARKDELRQNRDVRIQALVTRHTELGGAAIENLEIQKKGQEAQHSIRQERRSTVAAACTSVGWTLPETPEGFAELSGKARHELERWGVEVDSKREGQFALVREKQRVEQEFVAAAAEARSLKLQPTTIRHEMLELRARIAEKIKVGEHLLPFVGELIQVKPAQTQWRPAAERLLHGFAMSLLVDESQYAALAEFINNTHLGERLVYYRIEPRQVPARALPAESLYHKLDIKEGRFGDWLRAELHQRFDYACVESIKEFQRAERAITREGQIKHSRTRHEKNDRRNISDRREWVLAFDNSEKRKFFEAQAQELGERLGEIDAQLKGHAADELSRQKRALHLQSVVNAHWAEIDLVPLLDAIRQLARRIEDTRKTNGPLKEVDEQLKKERKSLETIQEELDALRDRRREIGSTITRHTAHIERIRENPALVEASPFQKSGLSEKLGQITDPLSLENIDRIFAKIATALGDEMMSANDEIQKAQRLIERAFDHFRRTWPSEAADVDSTIASASDYFAKLQRLENDRLPDYENRFFELLDSQSNQNLAALATHINQARKDIMARMELVNQSLANADFNPGTYLQIQVDDRHLEPVREFKKELQAAVSDAWTKDRSLAERRFAMLKIIVDRLSSQDLKDRKWRDQVLDVREHVEFVGREFDSTGKVIEDYRSGAGKSGGQRQKLATACLAAALRYQLGGRDQGVPTYAAVVLDEAFDKADSEFTTLAMKIFIQFGFQMIVATPFKSVMTLEPFIGGACVIEIADRKSSRVLLIEYDTERHRLKLPSEAREAALVEDA